MKNINLLNSSLTLFFLSFLIIDTTFYKEIFGLKLFITDIIFILIFILIFFEYRKELILFFVNLKSYFFIEKISLIIFIIVLLKYILDYKNYYNLYQIITFGYVLILYFSFKYLFIKKQIYIDKVIQNFKYIFFISLLIIFISLFIYYFEIKIKNISLWENAIFYPYHKESIIHINGFLKNYNMFAYIMLPGFIFFVFNNCYKKPYFFIFYLIIFSLILGLFIKAKIFLLVFSITALFFIFCNFQHVKYAKTYLFIILSLIILTYTLITNFIFIDSININNSIIKNNPKYFTIEPLFSFYNYDVYGSFFYKLKFIAFQQAKSFDYLMFQSIDFISFSEILSNNKDLDYKIISNSDPHSHYFTFFGEYGLIGLIVILFFSIYPFYLLSKKDIKQDTIPLLIILIIFYIEGMNTDIINFRFIWIILALLYAQLYAQKDLINSKNLS